MGHRIKQQKKNTNKQTINKQQTKKFSNSITIREMQIKTMFRFHMTQSERWSLRKQWQMLPRTQGKGMLIHCWWHSHSGKVWRCLKALKNRTAQYSISITSGNIPKGFHTCRAKGGGESSAILPSNEHWPPREDVSTTETVALRLGATQLPSGCLCDTAGRICVWKYEPHCLSFTSISEIKHPGPKQHRGKGVYFSLKCQVTPFLYGKAKPQAPNS